VTRWTLRGTHRGGLFGVKINGNSARDHVEPGGEAGARSIEGARGAPHLQEDNLDQLL